MQSCELAHMQYFSRKYRLIVRTLLNQDFTPENLLLYFLYSSPAKCMR